MITQEWLLKEYLEYRDGHLWWIKPRQKVRVGQQFGSHDKDGYRVGMLKGKLYKEHHLVWFYHYGVWPKEHIDHINGIRNDNRIENLREATRQQNQFNKKSLVGSSSQYKGVCWHKANKKWIAQYVHKSKTYYLGIYETEEEAAEAYRKATEHLHKDYANYG